MNNPDPRPFPLILVRVGSAMVGVALLFSLWASPDRLGSLPWFIIAIVGVSLVLVLTHETVVSRLAERVTPHHLLQLFLFIGFLTLLSALFTSRWPDYKLSWLSTVYAQLPSVRSLPWEWTKQGLQPNQTGGIMALVTGFACAVALTPGLRIRERWESIFLTVSGTVVVFMTGSRAALAGLGVSIFLLLVLRTIRWLWLWGPALAAVVLIALASGWVHRAIQFFLHDEALDAKLVARLDIWSSALSGIQDHFLTGIGLGVFNQVMPIRYPYQTVGLSYPVSQAHNLFLDVTLAIGFPGVLGLVLLLTGTLALAVRDLKQSGAARAVGGGILASMLFYVVFGITDSISLSIPTSFIIWISACAVVINHTHAIRSYSDKMDDNVRNNLPGEVASWLREKVLN